MNLATRLATRTRDLPGGKGDLSSTEGDDHILGTTGADQGNSPTVNNSISAEEAEIDYAAAGLESTDLLIDLLGGDDLFNGFAGDDWVHGGDGDDDLNGHEGDDVLSGGAGDDTIEGGAGADLIDGGEGDNDTASYADAPEDDPLETDLGIFNGVAVSLARDQAANSDAEGDELDGIENLTGSAFDDLLEGDDNANVLSGNAGDDRILGNGGEDTIVGGDGADLLTGGADADTFLYNATNEAELTAEGGDTITDFSGTGGDGDTIDLTALGLDDIAATNGDDVFDDGYLFRVDAGGGDFEIYVDFDGGGTADGTVDDVLVATLIAPTGDLEGDLLV